MAEEPAAGTGSGPGWDVTDADVYEAMREVPGYLDITPSDFRVLYAIARRHALERLQSSIAVRDLMVREVVAADPDTPLQEVADRMHRTGVSGLPVIDSDRKVLGVISESDFIASLGGRPSGSVMGLIATCLEGGGCLALPFRRQRARDIMSAPPVTVSETDTIAEAAAAMLERNVNRVPVLSAGGRLIGILTRGDLVRAQAIWPSDTR